MLWERLIKTSYWDAKIAIAIAIVIIGNSFDIDADSDSGADNEPLSTVAKKIFQK